MAGANKNPTQKIGAGFTEILGRLNPSQKVRAILLLSAQSSVQSTPRRRAGRDRRASANAVREASEPGLREIDKILERHKGSRLAAKADVLGSIAVETTPAGISALADSDHVKAILEDQPIFLLPLGRQ